MIVSALPRISAFVGVVLAGVLGAACANSPPRDTWTPSEPVEALLEHSRAALGLDAFASAEPRGLLVRGHGREFGLENDFSLRFTPEGAFLLQTSGRLGETYGFDGNQVLAREMNGLARVLELEDADERKLVTWVIDGFWLDPGAPLDISWSDVQPRTDRALLDVSMRGAPLEMTLALDRATSLPCELSRTSESGTGTWTFEAHERARGLVLPRRFDYSNDDGIGSQFEITEVAPAPVFVRDPFEFAALEPPGMRFDASLPAEIGTRRVPSGHLLVHPKVDGEDIGWFVLDSGAGGMVIDRAAADRLGEEAFGEVLAVGGAGKTVARFRAGKHFELGPLTFDEPLFLELDLAFISQAFGVPIGGIVGYDLFARAVVELESASGRVALVDSAGYTLSEGSWQRLVLDERIPCIEARFEGDRAGLFKLDSGSDATVIFHAPAVRALKLLEGRKTTPARNRGVGGTDDALTGGIEWFELGGLRFDNLPASFSRTEFGALADRYTTGNIGQGLLAAYRIVFDYPGRRLALVPLTASRDSTNR